MRIRQSELDKLFSRYVRLLADGKCEYCGKPKPIGELETSHFYGRRNPATRYDCDNCIAACFSCHIYLGEHPYEHTMFFEKRLGSVRFEELVYRSQSGVKLKPRELEALKMELKEKIAVLEGN